MARVWLGPAGVALWISRASVRAQSCSEFMRRFCAWVGVYCANAGLRSKCFPLQSGLWHIPILFSSFAPLPKIEAIALLGIGSNKNHATIGGAHLQMVSELLLEIRDKIPNGIASQVVPEQFVILRTLQFAKESWAKPASKPTA